MEGESGGHISSYKEAKCAAGKDWKGKSDGISERNSCDAPLKVREDQKGKGANRKKRGKAIRKKRTSLLPKKGT